MARVVDEAIKGEESESEPEVEVVEEDEPREKKRRRFKFFVVFHGDRATRRLPHSVRVKCPRDGSWEFGPRGPALVLEAFCARYAQVYPRTPLAEAHLVNAKGLVLDNDDELKLYAQSEGVLHVMLGPANKPKPNVVLQWGYNALASKERIEPSPVIALARKRVTGVDCGWLHAAAVLESGALVTWGSNDFGQLGTGDEKKSAEPVFADLPVAMRAVKCGSYFTCCVDHAGDLYSWGRYQASNWPTKFVDTWVNGYAKRGEKGISGEVVTMIACGEAHTVVATQSHKVFSWGYNEQWQLGWGERESEHQGQQKPRQVNGLPSGTIDSLSAGGQHTCCVVDGKLYAWGANYDGQIGHVLRQAFGEPQLVTSMESERCVSVSCGRHSTLAIAESGRNAFLWGSLQGSQQQQIIAANEEEGEAPDFAAASRASSLLAGAAKQLVASGVSSGRVGEAHGLLVDSNSLKGWGYNAYGQATAKIDPNSDVIEHPERVHLDDYYDPTAQSLIDVVAAGGTTTLLVSAPP